MDTSELADIAACQRGELTHFDPLYVLHVDAVYRYLYRRTLHRETAEDLTSTVFLKALESICSFDSSKGMLRVWLYRIARNALIDYYRSRKTTVDIEDVWDLAGDEVATLGAERAIDIKALHEAMKTLTPDQREIVLLRIWEGLSYAEIAGLTGKTEGNAKVIFSRSVQDLKAHMPALLLLLLFPHSL
jgi:RNA polymerase sigma-70 factor (ECF subfamily)